MAQYLISTKQLSPNCVNIEGVPLLNISLSNDNKDFTRFLLEQKDINVNAQDPLTGNTPLYVAGVKGNNEAIKTLLLNPAIDVSIKNKQGTPGYFRLLPYNDLNPNAKVLESLKGISKNEINDNKFSLVSGTCKFYSLESLEQVLQAGFDVNAGKPSALRIAIRNGDRDKINLLLRYGASVQESFADALFFGTPEIVTLLMNQPNFDPNASTSGLMPLVVAARLGHRELIQKLIDLGGKISGNDMMESAIDRMAALKDFDTAALILKHFHSECPDLNYMIFSAFYKDHPNFVAKLIQQGELEPNSSNIDHLFQEAFDNLVLYKDLMRTVIAQAAAAKTNSLNGIISNYDYTEPNRKEVLKLLLEKNV